MFRLFQPWTPIATAWTVMPQAFGHTRLEIFQAVANLSAIEDANPPASAAAVVDD